jgi:hypothetical protein
MSIKREARYINVGDKIRLGDFLEVVSKNLLFDANTFSITLQESEEKYIALDIEADSLVELEAPDEMPDEGEIMDRLMALAREHCHIGTRTYLVLEMLVEKGVIDISRLIEITDDLGPVGADIFGEPVRSCRVCGCTDDDCSKCIEATGEPCHWVGEDLCSRCAIPPMGNKAYKLEGNEWVYHKELDETPCDDCHLPIKDCFCK